MSSEHRDDDKKQSVLEDKEKFGTKKEDEKLSHMGDKPAAREEGTQQPGKK